MTKYRYIAAIAVLLLSISSLKAKDKLSVKYCDNVRQYTMLSHNKPGLPKVSAGLEQEGFRLYRLDFPDATISLVCNPKADFISSMFEESTLNTKDKKKFFNQLDNMLKSKKRDPEVLVDAFNGIFYANFQWDADIVSWLERNINDLPTPFYLLLSYKSIGINFSKSAQYLGYYMMAEKYDSMLCLDEALGEAIRKDLCLTLILKPLVEKKAAHDMLTNKPINRGEFLSNLSSELAKHHQSNVKRFENASFEVEDAHWVYYHSFEYAGSLVLGKSQDINRQFVDRAAALKMRKIYIHHLKSASESSCLYKKS